jgi:alpha-glucosidase
MLLALPAFNASAVYLSLQLSGIANALSPGFDAGSVDRSGETQAHPVSVLTSPTAGSVTADEAASSYRAIFTVPPSADKGAPLLPNIKDPDAVDPQLVCPGYSGSNVVRTDAGLTATLKLAGEACNVYGTDIEFLNLTVEYQSADRLSVKIAPAHLDASNVTQYQLPLGPVLEPGVDFDAGSTSLTNDLRFIWSNDPTFSFSIYRKSTGDTLFSTAGSKIVFENQFVEFSSPLPDNYNLYGLGETIHSFRLGNNYTKTMYNADVGDPID